MTVLKVLTNSPTDSFRFYLMFGGIWHGSLDYASSSVLVFSTPERNQVVFNGIKLQYDDTQENPWIGGTVTSIVLWNSDYTRKIAEISGLNVDLSELGPKIDEPLYSMDGVVSYLFSGNDSLVGSAHGDSLYADDGNDTVLGGAGDDYITPGRGSDVINGGSGFDIISFWNYSIFGELDGFPGVTVDLRLSTIQDPWGGADQLFSIEGVEGSNYNDVLIGNDSRNVLYGLTGQDKLVGGGGDDFFVGGKGVDTFEGGDGSDMLSYADYVGARSISIDLSTGTVLDPWGDEDSFSSIEGVRGTGNGDILTGGEANDFLQGMGGDDTIDGSFGNDRVSYLADNNWGGLRGVNVNLQTGIATDGFGSTDTLIMIENVDGTDYADTITGNAGSNVLFGGLGKDILSGLNGSDTVDGGDGNDKLSGNSGNDEVYGGAGNDVVKGDDGNDWVAGGSGNDTLTGGRNRDGFIFDMKLSAKSNVDRITDYSMANDTVYLDRSIFTKLRKGWLNPSAFVVGTKAQDVSDRIVYDSGTGELFYDPDGTGRTAQVKFAVFANKAKLLAFEFFAY